MEQLKDFRLQIVEVMSDCDARKVGEGKLGWNMSASTEDFKYCTERVL